MSTLAAWNEQFGELDVETPDKKKGDGFPIKTGVAYHVLIRGASLCRSKFGDVQIMLDLDVKDGDNGKVMGSFKDWLSLPMQPETDLTKDKDMVLTLTRVRRNMLATILASVDPRRFMAGDPVTEENGERRYLSWEHGHVLSRDEYNAEQIRVNRAVLAYAGELHEMLESSDNCPTLEGWKGCELYHARKDNPKNEKYPYSMWYREAPLGMPVYMADNTSDAPF